MTQYTIPIDTNQLPKLPTRDDVETWWMTNDQSMNFRSEHDWTIDGPGVSAQIFVGTHAAPSGTHDDDSGVLDSDETYVLWDSSCKLIIYCGTHPPELIKCNHR